MLKTGMQDRNNPKPPGRMWTWSCILKGIKLDCSKGGLNHISCSIFDFLHNLGKMTNILCNDATMVQTCAYSIRVSTAWLAVRGHGAPVTHSPRGFTRISCSWQSFHDSVIGHLFSSFLMRSWACLFYFFCITSMLLLHYVPNLFF